MLPVLLEVTEENFQKNRSLKCVTLKYNNARKQFWSIILRGHSVPVYLRYCRSQAAQ